MNYGKDTSGQVPTPAETLQEALVSRLTKGLTVFTYIKKDGSTRLAFGTTNRELIPPISRKDYDRQMDIIQQEVAKIQSGVMPEEPVDRVPVEEALTFLENYFNKPKKAGNTPEGYLHYWDFQAGGWRMFKLEELQTIITSITPVNGSEIVI